MNAARVMLANLKTCRPTDPLRKALLALSQNETEALPVVDAHGHLVGVVTEAHITELLRTQPLADPRVESAMLRRVFCGRPSDTLESLQATMSVFGSTWVPIIDDDGRYRGLVTADALLGTRAHKPRFKETANTHARPAIAMRRRFERRHAA